MRMYWLATMRTTRTEHVIPDDDDDAFEANNFFGCCFVSDFRWQIISFAGEWIKEYGYGGEWRMNVDSVIDAWQAKRERKETFQWHH